MKCFKHRIIGEWSNPSHNSFCSWSFARKERAIETSEGGISRKVYPPSSFESFVFFIKIPKRFPSEILAVYYPDRIIKVFVVKGRSIGWRMCSGFFQVEKRKMGAKSKNPRALSQIMNNIKYK